VSTEPTFQRRELDPWSNHPIASDLGGSEYGPLLEAFRRLQDAFSGALLPPDDMVVMTRRIDELAETFQSRHMPERQAPAGTRADLPGRGSPLLLPLIVDEWTDQQVRGRVTFTRFHLGGNGAAHGGTLTLLFDEVLGRLANTGDRPIARTAYLHTNYRAITRIGIEHTIEADLDRVDGRKRWVRGVLRDPDGVVVSDAEGLFVELRPGQP
jgi:acyl-coenzyme A thioesterase PaaI-like protein